MNKIELKLCDIQGRLFELSVDSNLGSESFVRIFMQSDTAKALDSRYNRMQWAGEEYLLEEICSNNKINKNEEVTSKEVMYWIGYTYRYWQFYTGEVSKQIYRQADFKTMERNYMIFHTLSPVQQIQNLKEIYQQKHKSSNKDFREGNNQNNLNMRILDLDMDYFMDSPAIGINEEIEERLSETEYAQEVWSEKRVRNFLENNLGLSTDRKIRGKIIKGHNEALFFWKELISEGKLLTPFEVVHVDSHADLGLGYSSWYYIMKELLKYPVEERPYHNSYTTASGKTSKEGIGDYLLFAIAYRWISKLTYCANPNGDNNDYILDTLKNFEEELIWDKPVKNTIQLLYNPNDEFPKYDDSKRTKQAFISRSTKEPEVPFLIIPKIEDVKYNGDFDFISLAQSPNYTPKSADFIIDIFKEYIID